VLVVIWLILGFLLGAVYLAWTRRHGLRQERRLLAVGLAVAALIYLLFAAAAGSTDWLIIEAAGLLVYSAIAWLGTQRSVVWLAAGWGCHPLWDMLLHLNGEGARIAPDWYVIACLSFDLLVAGYVLRRRSCWQNVDRPEP